MKYYTKDSPSKNEIVYTKFNRLLENEQAVIVNLIEYDNIEGMLLFSEISKNKRKKINIKKMFGNNTVPLMVITCGNHIDLSYVKILKDEIEKYDNMFPHISKLLSFRNNLVSYAKNLNYDLCLDNFLDDIKNNDPEKYYSDTLKNPTKIFVNVLDEDIKNNCINLIKSKTTSTNVVISKEFKLIVLEENGINKIKEILNINIQNLRLEYLSPLYKVIVTAETMNDANNIMKEFTKCVSSKISDSVVLEINDNVTVVKDKTYCLSGFKNE